MKKVIHLYLIIAIFSLQVNVYSMDDEDSVFTYGSDYLKQSVMQTGLVKMNEDEVGLRNMLENTNIPQTEMDERVDLKGPRAGSEPAGEIEGTKIVIEYDDSDENTQEVIEKLIPKDIFEYLNNRETLVTEYMIIENGEYYNVFWAQLDEELQPIIYTQTFDASGADIYERPFNLGRYIYGGRELVEIGFPEAIKLENGNTVILIRDADDEGYSHIRVSVFNSKGEVLGTHHFDGIDMKIQELSGGKFALFWNTYNAYAVLGYNMHKDAMDGKINLYMQVVEADGCITKDKVKMNGNRPQEPYARIIETKKMSNGNVFVVWEEAGYYHDDDVRARILTGDGEFEGDDIMITNGKYTYHHDTVIFAIEDLTDGNILLVWSASDDPFEPWMYVHMRIFSKEGDTVVPETDLYKYNSYVSRNDAVKKVKQLSNGDIIIVTQSHDSQYQMNSFALFKYDYEKRILLSPVIVDIEKGSLTYACDLNNVLVNEKGEVSLFWKETSQDYKRSILKMKRYRADLTEMSKAYKYMDFGKDERLIPYFERYIDLPNGNLFVVWRAYTEKNYYYGQIFDENAHAVGPQIDMGEYYSFIDYVVFDNGNVAIMLSDREGTTREFDLNIHIYSMEGRLLKQKAYRYSLYSDEEMVNIPFYSNNGRHIVKHLADDNLFVVLSHPRSDSSIYDDVRIQIIDSYGDDVIEEKSLTGDIDANCVNIDKIVMEGKNISVYWKEKDVSKQQVVKKATLDRQGNPVDERVYDYSDPINYIAPVSNKDSRPEMLFNDGYNPWRWRGMYEPGSSKSISNKISENSIDRNIISISKNNPIGSLYMTCTMSKLPDLQYEFGGVSESNYLDGIRRSLEQTMPAIIREGYDKENDISGILEILESKKDLTYLEETILSMTRSIVEEFHDMEKDTIKEFEETVRLVMVVEAMEDIVGRVDFTRLAETLNMLEAKRIHIYDEYLNMTSQIYEELADMLGINIMKDVLPDRYISLGSMNEMARRKILVDTTLNNLHKKQEVDLTQTEKIALKTEYDKLRSFRQVYIDKMKTIVKSFTQAIKEMLEGQEALSMITSDTDLKALFLLDRNNSR